MGPIFRFLSSLRSLAKSRNITIEDAYKFAQQEFGEVNELLKLQINKIFKDVKAPSIKKPSKPEGKVIETSFKPAVDKKEMYRPKQGLQLSEGITRALARKILDSKRIQIAKGQDPIDVFTDIFGEAIGDVKNLADEMVEIDQAGGGLKNMDEMLKAEGLYDIEIPKSPQRGLTDEELIKLIKDKEPEEFATGGKVGKGSAGIFDQLEMDVPHPYGHRVEYAMGSLPKGIQALVKQINKRFGKDTMKTADEMERPESAKLKEMFEDFEKRTERKILDVPEVPKGFKTSKEKLMQQFPEIDEDFAEQMMQMDKDLLGRTIMMLKDRRRNPELYDELLEKYGDTLEFQGEFDKAVRRKQNAGGGLAYLMGL